jgi:hypothetical protein
VFRKIGSWLLAAFEWTRERLEDLWVVDKPQDWKPPPKDPRNGL